MAIVHRPNLFEFYGSRLSPKEIEFMDNAFTKPNIKIVENNEGLVITAEILGFSNDEIDFDFDKGVLTITGKKKTESTPEKGSGESFSLSLRLPEQQEII